MKNLGVAITLLVAAVVAFVLSGGANAPARGPVLADTGADISMALALFAALVIAAGGAFLIMWFRSGRKK
ncbi:LPXTG cell wall anchor domain-containing protein [Propionicicella superfundia]|uniref:LPXTG cell wall anchor domain-containing protein n=1 Tax=Propionicicella superfundia TaxID=348582 RepID=UPI000424CEA3|nr:LPXTG cell wall anchor domain-containing protein [Propionicicella superfundia]